MSLAAFEKISRPEQAGSAFPEKGEPSPGAANRGEALAGEADRDPPAVLAAYSDVQRLERDRDWQGIVDAADTVAHLVDIHDAASTRLHLVRLARARALFRLGRGREAHDSLLFIERFNGADWQSRQLFATVLTHLGDHAGALAACSDALISLPLDAKPSQTFRDICVQRANALIMLGCKTDARHFLRSILTGLVPKYAEFGAMRRTVDSAEALEEFFTFLAPMFSFPGHRARSALHHYSLACRDYADPAVAIAAARQRFLSGLEIVGFGAKAPAANASWTAEAAMALHDLRSDLEALRLQPFLVSGTLLGCVRDHDIIGHDKDIDLGVLTDTPALEVRTALGSSGRFAVRPLNTDRLVQVQHANGVMLDVFLHWREGDLIWHEGQKARWWNSNFELEPTVFLGQEFLIPTNPEKYLAENYGEGWRTPEPDFETFVDTPNMVIHDENHLTWYYFSKLHDYYHAGKPKQFRKVWAALEPRIGEDGAVRRAVERVLIEGDTMLRAMAATDEVGRA